MARHRARRQRGAVADVKMSTRTRSFLFLRVRYGRHTAGARERGETIPIYFGLFEDVLRTDHELSVRDVSNAQLVQIGDAFDEPHTRMFAVESTVRRVVLTLGEFENLAQPLLTQLRRNDDQGGFHGKCASVRIGGRDVARVSTNVVKCHCECGFAVSDLVGENPATNHDRSRRVRLRAPAHLR